MRDTLSLFLDQASGLILDKPHQVRLTLACLLAGGHLLVEDEPGTGKTTLARCTAGLLGLEFQRIQCTSDMLPGDMLGVSVFDRDSNRFLFHPGPIFSQFVLVDEINRASPKTQSGLLEAMTEGQVSLDRQVHPLPRPFFLIATQNPAETSGTYPLPQSQLDRFLMRITLGPPSRRAEMELLQGRDRSRMIRDLEPLFTPESITGMQEHLEQMHVSEPIHRYILDLVQHTRQSGDYWTGLSPRAGLDLVRSSKAWAFIEGRDYVLPEDVQSVFPWVAAHRLQLREAAEQRTDLVDHLQNRIKQIPIP